VSALSKTSLNFLLSKNEFSSLLKREKNCVFKTAIIMAMCTKQQSHTLISNHFCDKEHANVNICSNLPSNAIIYLLKLFFSVKVELLTPVGAG
jgi:hypothetical protein